MGRKRNNQPALAYDYRRALALVQVLAIEDAIARMRAARELAHLWGIPDGRGPLLTRLAQHALGHARG